MRLRQVIPSIILAMVFVSLASGFSANVAPDSVPGDPRPAANCVTNNTYPGMNQQIYTNSPYNFTTNCRDDTSFNRVWDSANLIVQQSDQVAYSNTSLTNLGQYNATYSFYNDRAGGLPEGFTAELGTGGVITVEDSYLGHRKVAKLTRGSAGATFLHLYFDDQTSGNYSTWFMTTGMTSNNYPIFAVYNGVTGAWGLNLYNSQWYYYTGTGGWVATGIPTVTNRWYYISVGFRLDVNKVWFWVDGNLIYTMTPTSAWNGIDHIFTGLDSASNTNYLDAIDLSWEGSTLVTTGVLRNAIDLGQMGVYNATYTFETDTIFSTPAGWTDNSGAGCSAKIYPQVATGAYGHHNILALDDESANACSARLSILSPPTTIEFWVYITNIAASTNPLTIYFYDAGIANYATKLAISSNNWVIYSSGGTANTVLAAASNTWVHFRLTFDYVNNRVSCWANGMLKQSNLALYSNVAVGYLILSGDTTPTGYQIYFDSLDLSTDPDYYPERSSFMLVNSTQTFSVPGSYSSKWQLWSAGTCYDQNTPVPFQVVSGVENAAVILSSFPTQDLSLYAANAHDFTETIVDATGTNQFTSGALFITYPDGSTREHAGVDFLNASGTTSIEATGVILNITGQYSFYVVAYDGGYSIRSTPVQFEVVPNVELISTSTDATNWKIFSGLSYTMVYEADFSEWSGPEFWAGFEGNYNYSGSIIGDSTWAGTTNSSAYLSSNIVLLGYPPALQVGDVFTITFVTNSSQQIVLTSSYFTPTTVVIVPEKNAITTSQNVTFMVTNTMNGGYATYSITGNLDPWSCFNLTGIMVVRPVYQNLVEFGIGAHGTRECVITPGTYSVLITSSLMGFILKNATVTIGSGKNIYFMDRNLPSERQVTLYDQNHIALDFNQFQCALTYTVAGSTLSLIMTNNKFYADDGSLYTLLVYDHLGQLLANRTNWVITTLIEVQIPNIYSVKIQNLMKFSTQITLTKYYSSSQDLATGEIATFNLYAATYQLDYPQSELGTFISTTIDVTGPMLYVLNTSYHSVFFTCFSNDGLGLPSETCRLYVNQSSSLMVRVPWGPVELLGMTNVTVLDYLNDTQYSAVLDLADVSEMCVFVNIASLVTNNIDHSQVLALAISKNGTLLQNQTLPPQSSLLFRFTNGHYDLNCTWDNGTVETRAVDVWASGTDLTTYMVSLGTNEPDFTALHASQLYAYAAFGDIFPWVANVTDDYAQFYSVVITNQLANDSAVYFEWNGVILRYEVSAQSTYPLPLYVPRNATYRMWNGETQQFVQDSYVALSMNATNGQVLLVLGQYAPIPDYSWTGILIPIIIFGCVMAFFTIYIVKIKRTPRGEYR